MNSGCKRIKIKINIRTIFEQTFVQIVRNHYILNNNLTELTIKTPVNLRFFLLFYSLNYFFHIKLNIFLFKT